MGVHDARRYQAQNGFLAVDPEGMTGVVTPLEAHHTLRRLGEPVNDLTLAFVTPLGADYHNILAHVAYQLKVGPFAAKAKRDSYHAIRIAIKVAITRLPLRSRIRFPEPVHDQR